MAETDDDLLHAKLNAEAARLHWSELQPHYARGAVVKVAPDLDLIAVAVCMARDDKEAIEGWLAGGGMVRADDVDARDWEKRNPVLWAVVVAPWVLVQERTAS